MIQWMLAIWPLVPLPFLNPVCTSGSSLFTYCWSLTWRILSITLLACEMNASEKNTVCLPIYLLIDLWFFHQCCMVFQHANPVHVLWNLYLSHSFFQMITKFSFWCQHIHSSVQKYNWFLYVYLPCWTHLSVLAFKIDSSGFSVRPSCDLQAGLLFPFLSFLYYLELSAPCWIKVVILACSQSSGESTHCSPLNVTLTVGFIDSLYQAEEIPL